MLKLASNTPGTLKRFLGAVISNWFQLEFLADDRYISYPWDTFSNCKNINIGWFFIFYSEINIEPENFKDQNVAKISTEHVGLSYNFNFRFYVLICENNSLKRLQKTSW